MEPEFWIERWKKNEIGFHQQQYNCNLLEFWPALMPDAATPVFVPLCGKSADMVWLHERGHTVYGVDISPIAVAAFFQELQLVPRITAHGALQRYEAARYTIWCGDLFDLDQDALPGIAAVYDRASLVALPPNLRARYAQHLAHLTTAGTPVLLVTLDYPGQQMDGPPFSVGVSEINTLYARTFEVRELVVRNTLDDNPRFRERGLTRLDERVFSLIRKSRADSP